MSRANIEQLGPAPPRFRVDQRTDALDGLIKFEDEASCRAWDESRLAAIERRIASGTINRHDLRAAMKYASYLRNVLAGKKKRLSAASRVQMREWRIRISGHLWAHVDQLGPDGWMFFTIILPSWWVKSSKLNAVSAKHLMGRLRQALHRAGSSDAQGWLYTMIHGEFDGATKGFPLHVHGIATGEMIGVLRRLRKQPQFRQGKRDRERYPHLSVRRKVKIDKPRGNLPAALTYASKSYWPQHDSRIDEDGERRRVGRKHRIDYPKHLVRHLLWLHAQPVKHQVLLVHLSVIDGQLVAGKRGVRDC